MLDYLARATTEFNNCYNYTDDFDIESDLKRSKEIDTGTAYDYGYFALSLSSRCITRTNEEGFQLLIHRDPESIFPTESQLLPVKHWSVQIHFSSYFPLAFIYAQAQAYTSV